MSTTNFTVRMDSELKKQAEELFSELGLSMSAAFTVFVKQAVYERGIPFKIRRNVPNAETISAMREAEDIISGKIRSRPYKNAGELFAELDSELSEEDNDADA